MTGAFVGVSITASNSFRTCSTVLSAPGSFTLVARRDCEMRDRMTMPLPNPSDAIRRSSSPC